MFGGFVALLLGSTHLWCTMEIRRSPAAAGTKAEVKRRHTRAAQDRSDVTFGHFRGSS